MPQVATEPDLRKLRLARAAEVLRLEARTIAQLEHRLDERFVQAVDLVLACSGMVVVTGVGKAGLVGQKLSATLASTGTPSIFLHPTEALHGDLGRIRAQDLVLALSNSGESAEISALLGPVRKLGARVLALTGVTDSTLGRHADCVLDIGKVEEACPMKLAPTASTSALLAMGDALAMVVLQERNFSREDYALYHPGGMLGRKLMRVREVMRKEEQLPLVKSGTKLAEVVRVMNRTPGRPGAALVVDGEGSGKLVGIFTHGDLARMLERNTLDTNDAVDLHMGKSPKTIRPEQLVEEAQHLLHEHRIDQIAVVDDARRAIGLLDVQDLLDVRIY
ncbi:MAG: KpsF/GutQ family sugar-phosphate isomerase [Planctomycetes bacterium]|nr:KpsF/GutQ family sugar-phosphate isomerase [Planctomycetota bacterium]